MAETKKSLLDIVNASGFLFQLRVEHEIRTLSPTFRNKWIVVAREHPWKDVESDSDGFIDLVLESEISRMVIECKRVVAGHWIFLIPDERLNMGCARLLWSYREEEHHNLSSWDEIVVTPPSPEAAFCVVRGQGEKDSPMLERLSSLIVRSAECLAEQELGLGPPPKVGRASIYIPAIVTNATLQICRFDPGKVDLATGQLPEADFETVPVVRFRKSLSTRLVAPGDVSGLGKLSTDTERTVFVINANELGKLLREWDGSPYGISGQWPWEVVRP